MESGVAPSLVLNKSDLTYAREGEEMFGGESDWRREFLGTALMKWLNERRELSVLFEDDQVALRMK